MNLHYHCYLLAFENDDAAAMERQLAWGRGSAKESVLFEHVAWAQMSKGRLGDARHTFAEARASATKYGLSDFSAELNQDEGWLDADLGLDKEAQAHISEALKLAPGRHDIEAFAALALARSGDIARAETAMTHVSKDARKTLFS